LHDSEGESTAGTGRVGALLHFVRSGAAGGFVLILSAAAALVWSNSPAADSYARLFSTRLPIGAGRLLFDLDLHAWVNDGLMALFFLMVGLEIRRETTEGQLASRQGFAAPAIAALGGMIVPAAIYAGFNYADPSALRGWAVPVATDIAFALAALSVVGRRVPLALRVFLTALAILDDLGAIVVIALFYTAGLNGIALLLAAVVLLALLGLNRLGIRALAPYLIGGVILWCCTYRSGVHATLSGVALALVIPMRRRGDEAVGPAIRLEHALQGWVAYLVLPLFGLANGGLPLNTVGVGVLTDPVALGVGLGLLIGKQAGVFGATMLAIRAGWARLPAGLTTRTLYGGSVLCGIGFTMSLFIGDLAFPGQVRDSEVKLAVFVASAVCAVAGIVILALFAPRRTE